MAKFTKYNNPNKHKPRRKIAPESWNLSGSRAAYIESIIYLSGEKLQTETAEDGAEKKEGEK